MKAEKGNHRKKSSKGNGMILLFCCCVLVAVKRKELDIKILIHVLAFLIVGVGVAYIWLVMRQRAVKTKQQEADKSINETKPETFSDPVSKNEFKLDKRQRAVETKQQGEEKSINETKPETFSDPVSKNEFDRIMQVEKLSYTYPDCELYECVIRKDIDVNGNILLIRTTDVSEKKSDLKKYVYRTEQEALGAALDKMRYCKEIEFVPFRYKLAMQSKPYLHKLDSHASQDKDWEIEILGIDLNSGRPYLELARQKSFGVFSGGENCFCKLSIEEYRKTLERFPNAPAWAKELNENNWETLLEQPLKEFSQRCLEKVTNFSRSKLQGPFPKAKGKPVDSVIIILRQSYGAQAAYFRKLQVGYRLFYARSTDPNFPYVPPFTELPSLKDRLLKYPMFRKKPWVSSSSADYFDRLLNQEETNAFLSELEARRPTDNKSWHDRYHSEKLQISILYLDGTEDVNSGCSYINRLLETAEELAIVGLNHKKNVSEASKE